METEGYSVSVCVDALIGVETGGAALHACVTASTEWETKGCGVDELGASLGWGSPSFGGLGAVVRAQRFVALRPATAPWPVVLAFVPFHCIG